MAQLAPAEVDVVIERALAELPFDDWQIIDTRNQDKGPRADFVVVGPPGVFVIGCGRRHEKERAHAKELMRLLEVAHQVAEVAGVRRDEVHPVLCLTGDQPEDSWSSRRDRLRDREPGRHAGVQAGSTNRNEVEAAALEVGRAMRSGREHRGSDQVPLSTGLWRAADASSRFGAGSSAWRSPLTSSVTSASSRALNGEQIGHLAALRAAGRGDGRPPFTSGWVPSDDGRCLTVDGDEKYGDPAKWLRHLIRCFVKPGGLRLKGWWSAAGATPRSCSPSRSPPTESASGSCGRGRRSPGRRAGSHRRARRPPR